MVPSINTGESFGGTSSTPANDSNLGNKFELLGISSEYLNNFVVKWSYQSLTAVLGGNEGTARISLAGVLS